MRGGGPCSFVERFPGSAFPKHRNLETSNDPISRSTNSQFTTPRKHSSYPIPSLYRLLPPLSIFYSGTQHHPVFQFYLFPQPPSANSNNSSPLLLLVSPYTFIRFPILGCIPHPSSRSLARYRSFIHSPIRQHSDSPSSSTSLILLRLVH